MIARLKKCEPVRISRDLNSVEVFGGKDWSVYVGGYLLRLVVDSATSCAHIVH